MYVIKKEWKEFNIALDLIDSTFKSMFDKYVGNQSHSVIELYFNEDLTSEELESLETFWEGVEEDHEVAVAYFSNADYVACEGLCREDAVTKAYDVLSVQQKKLLMGVDLTIEDKKQVIADFLV